MSRKKIIFLTYAGVPAKSCGGGNRVSYELMNGLNIHDFDLLHINSNGGINNSINHDVKINLVKKTKQFISKFLMKLSNRYLFARIKIQIKKKKLRRTFSQLDEVGILNAHDSIMLALVDGESIPKILSIHHKQSLVYDLENNASGFSYSKNYLNFMRLLEIESIKKADLIVFASKASLNNYQQQYQGLLAAKKTVVIYNGVDVNKIKKMSTDGIDTQYHLDSEKYDLHLINLANHIKPKNIEVLINAVDILMKKYHKNPLLINVGVGPLTDEYQKLVKQKGLEKNVRLLGVLNNDEVISLLKWAKYFIMASEKVVFDIVVLEAIAAGCCVIVTDDGGNKEIISDGYNGYLVKNIDPQIFADKIVSAEDRVMRNAVETALQYDISNTISKYENIFNLYLKNNSDLVIDG